MSDRRVRVAAWAAWAALVLAAALPVHAPDLRWVVAAVVPGTGGWTAIGALDAVRRVLRAAAGLALVLAACRGAGGRGARWLRTGESGAARWAAGLVIVGLGAAGLAFAGLATGWLVVAAVAAMSRIRRPAAIRRALRSAAAELRAAGRLPATAASVLVAIAALHAMAPEITADALRAGLGTPRDALAIGRWVPDAASPFAWYPLVPTGLGLALLPAGGEPAVRLGHVLAWAATAVALWRWLRGPAGEAVAALAGMLWLAGLNALVVASCAWTDHLLAWLVLAAARRQFGGARRSAGLIWGAAAAVKLQAAWPAAGAIAACAVAGGPAGALRLGLWMLPPVLPWVARNTLLAGSAVAPFGLAWGPDAAPVFAPPYPPVAAWMAVRDPAAVMAAPFRCATRLGVWDGLLSPALVTLLPLAVFASRPRSLRPLLAVALAGWAWTAGYGGRYLLPLAPLVLGAAMLGGMRLAGRRGIPPTIRRLAWGLAGFEAAASLALAFRLFTPAAAAWGRETPAAYLRRVADPRPAAGRTGEVLRNMMGPRDRYLLEGSLSVPGWPGRPRADEEGLPPRFAGYAARATDAPRLAIILRQEGIRGLVIRVAPAERDPGLVADARAWTARRRAVRAAWQAGHERFGVTVADGGGRFDVWIFPSRARKDR